MLVTTDEFIHDAVSSAQDNGMPPMRSVVLPAKTYYRARGNLKEVMPVALAALEQIVSGLTKPLTPEEANPKPVHKAATNEKIKVQGEDYADAAEKVNQLFLQNQWADGLPVLPPTEKAVKAMLKGTSRSPQEVIGLVAPKNGQATIEKIAINAVMAGAKPEYLPVIIAAMEGFTDKNFDLTHVQASTGSFVPVIIVSGPIAKELDFNTGIGFLGHGWRSNNTIGRALRLCLLNLGQTWPAVNDMALVGRVSPHTFFTFAENAEANPWEPYHVGLGYKPEESTVTVATVAGQVSSVGGGAVAPWTAQGILDTLVSRMSNVGTYLGGVYAATRIVVFHPDCAEELFKMGYTRKSLQDYFYQQSRVPYSKLSSSTVKEVSRMIDDGQIRPDRVAVFKEALKEGGMVPSAQTPEDTHILVAGGSPGYTLYFSYSGPNFAHQTRKIRGATLTKSGR
jgi:hypothetical protein